MVNSLAEAWDKVANLKPEVRSQNAISRHVYRGEVQYVLENMTTGQLYRFSPMVYRLVGMMNGKNSIGKICGRMNRYYGDDAPGKDEILQLLTQLNAAGALNLHTPVDIRQLVKQSKKAGGADSGNLGKIQGNVLFFKVALADPDRFLAATLPAVRFFFSKIFFIISLVLISVGLLQLMLHLQSFSADLFERLFTLNNSILLIVLYPIVKGLHELGHAYAVKIRGGEVHEMGIMTLIFMPLPYVDASSASGFHSKWQRIVVGIAGIYIELMLAALAVCIWISAEPGLIRVVAFNVIVICGASTLLFNGNPLVKFDGYYILSDLIEIPNLGQRSLNFVGYLVNRYLFGIRGAVTVTAIGGEQIWLVTYGICTILYRAVLAVTIIWYVSLKFKGIGTLLAIFGCYQLVLHPVARKIAIFANDPTYHEKRKAIILRISGVLAGFFVIITLLPMPYLDIMEGVIWLPEESHLRPGGDGVVTRIIAEPGSIVRRGDLLIECADLELNTRIAVFESQLREYRLRYGTAIAVDNAEAQMIKEQIEPLEKRIARYREQAHEMTIYSPADGRFVLPDSRDLPGRFVYKGELLGYVLSETAKTVRVAIQQKDLELVRTSRREVELKVVADRSTTLHGRRLRELPGATNRLPSGVLGSEGGGRILVDPVDEKGVTALQSLFLLDIELEKPVVNVAPDKRVFVRFNYGAEPLGIRAFRKVRQLFLGRHSL